MSTSRKKIDAAKKAATYSSTAAVAASSFLDLLGLFVGIPGLVKWIVIAAMGAGAGCLGCVSKMKEPDEPQENKDPEKLEHLAQDMEHYLAEMKQELAYHRSHPGMESKEAKLGLIVQEFKKPEKIPLRKMGMFSQDPVREPLLDESKSKENEIGIVRFHAELKDPGMGLGLR